jgi:pyruvate-formate lyase-activating enzyme
MTMQTAVTKHIQGFSIHDGPGFERLVFFKGCPLAWCGANPECLSGKPQMGFIETFARAAASAWRPAQQRHPTTRKENIA